MVKGKSNGYVICSDVTHPLFSPSKWGRLGGGLPLDRYSHYCQFKSKLQQTRIWQVFGLALRDACHTLALFGLKKRTLCLVPLARTPEHRTAQTKAYILFFNPYCGEGAGLRPLHLLIQLTKNYGVVVTRLTAEAWQRIQTVRPSIRKRTLPPCKEPPMLVESLATSTIEPASTPSRAFESA